MFEKDKIITVKPYYMLLDAILKAIAQIEKIENRSDEVDLILQELKDTVNSKMKENLMEFMSVGEKMGYEEIKKQLDNLSGFINSLEQK